MAGQVTPIPFDVEDPDGDFVHVYIEPVSLPGLELYYDRELGAYVIHVSKTYEGREEYSIRVWAYDLKPAMRGRLEPWEAPEEGQYHHKVLQVFILRITRNRPPIAISGSLTVSHGEIGCFGPVHYKGYDPDLPENFGFGLYFVALGFPANWDCSRMVDIYFSPLTHSLVPQQCIANICELLTTCTYWPCDWPRHPVPEGKYVFPFAVVEYKRWAIKPEEPENYGFSDAGHWTLIVNNKRPRVVVEPAEIKVAPGQIVAAMVKAEDDDNDWLELRQTGGPGSFPPKVEGLGKVQGTWSWTVPGRLLSYSGYASFVARDFASAGYGFLYVRTVNPPQASSAHALVPRGGTSTAYAYVHDPDSPWISVQPGPAPPGLSVSAQVEDDPFAPGLGGFLVVFEVSAERTLCDGVYTVPFTVTDPDGLSASALLTVRVVGNRPPEVRGAQGKEAVVQLTPAGVSAPPVVFVLELRDPDGDRPG
ncbi:MAG: hypothetical protein NZ924_00015 [Candidatus Bipolaricaulota bacterium]|nr:hypothetical protein [Candidatus Bipolaricaulota bacterium]MDW8151308.1 hypothetical protein [Candidatus Bipolaricaulota bacterium]